jgi:hypothetical protein
MSQEAVERFLGRLLTDDNFRDYACKSFARACIEEGFHFTEEEARIMRNINFSSFVSLSNELDKGIKRSVIRQVQEIDDKCKRCYATERCQFVLDAHQCCGGPFESAGAHIRIMRSYLKRQNRKSLQDLSVSKK